MLMLGDRIKLVDTACCGMADYRVGTCGLIIGVFAANGRSARAYRYTLGSDSTIWSGCDKCLRLCDTTKVFWLEDGEYV